MFQMLALNKKVGLLSIQSAKLWKVLYFDQRGVAVHHNVHRVLDRVVAAFVRAGRLTEQAVDEIRDHAARTGQPLADSLLAGGYVEAADLEEQYRLELDEEVYDLFFCRDAKFEFHEGATSLDGYEGSVDERFFSNCESIIMEAARRIDEWAYISERVPTTSEVLVATADSIDGERFGADGPAIFGMLDGRRNVARIVEVTGLSNFQVCKVLSQLLDAGAIAPVAAEELLALAAECMGESRLQDAISLYERAISQGIGLPDAHSHVAKAYQAAEEYEHAVYHLECEAELRLAAGDRNRAAQRLNEVRQLVPTSLQARERLVELTLGPSRVHVGGFDALAEGKELVDLLIEFGDMQRVRAMLERLLLVEPNDPDLKKALVNVHLKAGDQKRVAELYDSIANDLVRQQKPLEAVAYLQKILLIDRSRADVSERVRKLYEFDERTRRRGKLLGTLAVVFVLLVALGTGYWFYNERAEADFAAIDVADLVAREDFAGAYAAYDSFVQTHPLTTAVTKANAELQQIEAARQQYEARRESERAGRERELKRIRDEYKLEWARHREQFLGGRPEQSMQTLTRSRELISQAGGAEDIAWALEQQIERTWTRLRDFLANAQRLAGEYDQKVKAGDWAAARALAVRLNADFDNTEAAKRCPLPVTIITRPAGATLLRNGTPLVHTVDGRTEPMTTPAVVLCAAKETVSLIARLDGFEPRQIVVEGRQKAQVEAVLAIVADRRVSFDAPVQTGAGVGGGWIAVGLRGGRIGLVRTDGTNRHVRSLTGLRAADSAPSLQNGRVFFTTNENTIECLALDKALAITGWPVTLSSPSATELMVGDGRIALVDRAGVLQCWEQATGNRVWAVSLGGPASGPPTIDRRQVHVGTTDGRVLTFDAADGRALGVLRAGSGLTTRVLADRGMLFFGCNDGHARAVDVADGRVLWAAPLGRNAADGELAIAKSSLLAIAGDGKLIAIDRGTGQVVASLRLDGEPQHGVRVQGGRALVQLRRPKFRSKPAHDVLLAMQADTLTVLWEHADEGFAPGMPGIDEFVVAVPSTSGEVVLFR